MKPASPPFNAIFSGLLVAAAGFFGGAVFIPCVVNPEDTAGAALLIVSGLLGSLAYCLLWLAVSAALSTRAGMKTIELSRRVSIWFAAGLLPLILYFPYMYHRSGLEGESVELPPLDSRSSAIILLLWSLLLLASLLYLNLSGGESALEKWVSQNPVKVLLVIMVVWLAVFFPLDVLKDHYLQTNTINSAVYRQAMMNAFDERGLLFSETILSSGASLFAVHINAIFFFILPLFRLWPDYRFLLLISDVALALTAIPAYYLARRYFAAGTSLMLALMVMLHPIMAAQPGRSDFSELRFTPLLIMAMFFFFDSRRFWLFTAFALALMTIREDMSLIVAFVGIYALFVRRSPRWVLTPLLGGIAYFSIANFYLLPSMNPGGKAVRADIRYSGLGSSGSEIIKTVLFRPWKAVGVAFSTPSHLGAVYGIILTFGLGIPLLSGAVLLAVTPVSELLLQSTTTLVNFMAVPMLATLMIAYILGLARLDRFCQKRCKLEKGRAGLMAGLIMFFLCLSAFHTWFNPDLYRPRYNYHEALEAFQMIPGDASVMLPETMLAYAKPDQSLSGFHQVTYQLEDKGEFEISADYILVDQRIPKRTGDERYYSGLIKATDFVSASPDFIKVYENNDIALYIREGHEPVKNNNSIKE